MTELVHGKENAKRVITMSQVLFDNDLSQLKATDIIDAFQNDKRLVDLKNTRLPCNIVDFAVASKVLSSKSKFMI